MRQALLGAQKSARHAPGYTRWVNRPAGRFLASYAFTFGLTPNQVTAISACLTGLGILLIALAPISWPMSIAIAAILAFAFALDSADGQLARVRGGGSLAGEWLDHVVDGVKASALHLAVLVGWYRGYDLDSEWLLLIPLLYAFEAPVFYFSIMLTEQLRRSRQTAPTVARREDAPVLRSVLVLPADYGLLCLAFALFAWEPVFIVLYTLFLVPNLVFLLGSWPKWYRELKQLDAEAPSPGAP